MKLDRDLPVLHPPVVQIPNPQLLQHRNNIVEPTKSEVVKTITPEKQDVLLPEVKGSKLIAVSLPSDLNDEDGLRAMSDFDNSIPCQDLNCGKGIETVRVTEGDLVGETELLNKDLDIFTDKKVTEFELPKVVVCCKGESSYHEVRDTCMDEGMVSDEKILFETNRDTCLGTILLPDKEAAGSLLKEKLDSDGSISNAFQVPQDHCPVVPVAKCCPDHLLQSAENSATQDLWHDSSAALGNEAEQQSAEVFHDESLAGCIATLHAAEVMKESCAEVAKDFDTICVKPTLLENCKIKSGGKEAISVTNESPYSSQVENRTITFSFAACAPTPSNSHESLCNENKELLNNQDGHKVDQGHAFFGLDQHSHEESSFSILAGPHSGLISYSGPIAYSGSVSLRSNSSIGTSTRSFAFPVLQSEWNTSPVRMAKANRRFYQKHFGWMRALLCCKF